MSPSGAYVPMSEQFAYWQTKGLDGEYTVPGSWLRYAFLGLQVQGCCTAANWPYQPDPVPGDEAGGQPPAGAVKPASANVQPNTQSIWPTDIDSIRSVISSGRGVAFSVPLFPSSYGASGAPATYTKQTGDFLNPIPGETTVGGHAMCMVGYFGCAAAPVSADTRSSAADRLDKVDESQRASGVQSRGPVAERIDDGLGNRGQGRICGDGGR